MSMFVLVAMTIGIYDKKNLLKKNEGKIESNGS